MNRRSIVTVACATALLLAACGSDDLTADTTAAPAATAAAAGVTIEGAWARTSPMNTENGAAYMMITSATDDALIAAAVDPSIAERAEVHEVTMADDSMSGDSMPMGSMPMDSMPMNSMPMNSMPMNSMPMDSMPMSSDMSGNTMAPMMQMREVESVALPAGTPVVFAPGGYHIMLVGLTAPLELDQEFVVTLTFEQAGDVDVTVTVADDAP